MAGPSGGRAARAGGAAFPGYSPAPVPFRLPEEFDPDPCGGFVIYRGVVAPDWTDRNGHMNVVYYRLAFDRATQRLLTRIGLWDNDHDHGSTFALEDHVTYQSELHPGRAFFVTYQLLDHSEKLIHAFLRLYGESEGGDGAPALAATCEHIGCYVDMRTRRSAVMPAAFTRLLDEVAALQRGLPGPPEQGRVIGIRRRSRPDDAGAAAARSGSPVEPPLRPPIERPTGPALEPAGRPEPEPVRP